MSNEKQEYYKIKVAGLERDLPICALNDKLSIAGFVMLGDYELTEACARELNKILPPHDYLIAPEAKAMSTKWRAKPAKRSILSHARASKPT